MWNEAPALIVAGHYDRSLHVFPLDAAGLPGAGRILTLQGTDAPFAAATALETVRAGGRDLFILGTRQAEGLMVWQDIGQGRLQALPQPALAGIFPAGGVAALAQHDSGAGPQLLVLAAGGEGLFSYRIAPDGRLHLTGQIDGRDGLAISQGTRLEIVTLAGQDYALVGAAGRGSLAVVALDGQGGMVVTDHVLDDRMTRFAGLTELAVAS